MKGELSTRPIFVNTAEHIEAHLAICTIALTVMRIIQYKVALKTPQPQSNALWSYGMSAERVISALNSWTIDKLPEDYFRFNNIDESDLKKILDAFDIQIPLKLYRRQELKSLKSLFKITT